MTKEELLEVISFWTKDNSHEQNMMLKGLDNFFESNICIPKGANRHPNAAVLHQWAEGYNIQYKYDYQNEHSWHSYGVEKSIEFRIKPPKPVYEWQWAKDKQGREIARSSFFTDAEAKEFLTVYWEKDETTKRLRA